MTFAMAGCASLPPPTAELDAAQQAVARADAADGDQYAAAELAQARAGLAQAQAAMARGRDDEARSAAVAAAADADLAQVLSRAAVTRAEFDQQQSQITELRGRLQIGATEAVQNPLDTAPATAPAAQRLQLLDADTRLNPFAQYERLQARQALAVAQAAGKRERVVAERLADRRVGVAEQAARIEAARRVIDGMERERSDLLVEASRLDAERARAEAERLRIEAQVQAEEAARLRAQAEQAEAVLDTAQIDQGARVTAAREKEAALARQEAELTAGATLPPMRKDSQGDVFTLAGDAFGSGQAQLTAKAAASVKALGLYLKTMNIGGVQVLGHTDSQGEAEANRALSQRRADAVRAALADAGFNRSRITAQGRGEDLPMADNSTAAGRAKNRRVEILVAN
ncbi:OmpA family protein [Thermomonas sp. HDW16]|uniref:OmpA family protein n=1 Tax=Thermomonas sp. HDW16 TaxID=2714945 RepID=UPI00140B164F|nr:OmpA family protein [Thermomonas sp. HDW16]QIL21522.1 OmpA family protein [Thermomonas sp. HDW16]